MPGRTIVTRHLPSPRRAAQSIAAQEIGLVFEVRGRVRPADRLHRERDSRSNRTLNSCASCRPSSSNARRIARRRVPAFVHIEAREFDVRLVHWHGQSC
jgi:hypothetical protein